MRRAREGGFTLIEMMIALGAMGFLIAGATLVAIAAARGGHSATDRANLQGSARTGIDVIASELQLAGLGLPKTLAIPYFSRTGGDCGTPVLQVASLDYRWEWAVSTAGNTAAGTISVVTSPKIRLGSDIAIKAGEWVYLYQSAKAVGGTGGAWGHGFVHVKADRAAGGNTVTVDATNFSTVQTAFDLGQTELSSSTTYIGHQPVMLRSRLTKIYVKCTAGSNVGSVFVSDGISEYPVAANVEVQPLAKADASIGAAKNDVVGLRFRFLVDQKDSTGATNPDGITDDQNGDHIIDYNDLVTDPTVAPLDLTMVTGIEVLIRARGEQVSQSATDYRYQDYVRVVTLPNIRTSTTVPYVFIDADGL